MCLRPLQNEAVVHAALIEFGAAIELISPSEILPRSTEVNLRRGRGLCDWRVPHPDFPAVPTLYASWEDVPELLREVRRKLSQKPCEGTGREGGHRAKGRGRRVMGKVGGIRGGGEGRRR